MLRTSDPKLYSQEAIQTKIICGGFECHDSADPTRTLKPAFLKTNLL
jgi:hypothetical protein